MSVPVKRGGLTIAAAATAMLALPALAGATVVGSGGGTMKITDNLNQPRGTQVTLGPGGNTIEVTEGGQPIVASAPCVNLGPNTVRCPIAGVTRIVVDARGGNDTIQVNAALPATLKTLLSGGVGDEVIDGGSGLDTMIGGPGGDQMIGNLGTDTVSYGGVRKPVRARIGGGGFPSGSTLDGPVGSRDQIGGDVEVLIGGSKPNQLRGNALANKLVGGPKQDQLNGSTGNDRVLGRGGNDYVLGFGGDDFLVGGKGRDKIGGGDGIDTLKARDGLADVVVNCGPPAQPEFVKFDQGLDFPVNC